MYSKKMMELFRNPHNMGKIENADGVGRVGNPVCLLPETKVHTISKIKPINNIKMGDMVLGHDGKYHEVMRIFKRKYKGRIIRIKNRFGTSFLTPEHEIFSIEIPKKHYYNYMINKKKNMASWRHTEELKIGDIVLYPISKDSKNVDKITFENKKLPFDYNSKSVPKNIFMDGKFLRLSGYYIAEGYLRDKVTKTYLSFTFGLNEDQFVDDVIAIIRDKFGIEARKKFVPEKNTIIIDVNSVMIVRLFKDLFDTGAENKHIPQFMMTLHPQKQKELIKGLWRGDGYFSVNRKWPRAGYSTISYELCQQLKLLLLRQGIIPSIYIEKEKVVNGVKHGVSYRIHIGNRDSMKKLSKILGIIYHNEKDIRNDVWIDKNYVYVPVTHISKMFYNGFVFNLEVDDAKSFTSDSLLLHNCGDVMYLYIKVRNDKISDIKFETFGCASAIATSSAVTDIAKGMKLDDALNITKDDVAKAVDGLPPIKMHCSLLAIDALKAAIDDYRKKK